MKTITLQGTKEQFSNLYQNVFDEDVVPKEVEIRVYVIEAQQSLRFNEKVYTNLTDEEFMSIAEENGTVYSINVFQQSFNDEEFNTDQVIRFINVPF